jgi:hypothetical protein
MKTGNSSSFQYFEKYISADQRATRRGLLFSLLQLRILHLGFFQNEDVGSELLAALFFTANK